jgi:hypothetical protein
VRVWRFLVVVVLLLLRLGRRLAGLVQHEHAPALRHVDNARVHKPLLRVNLGSDLLRQHLDERERPTEKQRNAETNALGEQANTKQHARDAERGISDGCIGKNTRLQPNQAPRAYRVAGHHDVEGQRVDIVLFPQQRLALLLELDEARGGGRGLRLHVRHLSVRARKRREMQRLQSMEE